MRPPDVGLNTRLNQKRKDFADLMCKFWRGKEATPKLILPPNKKKTKPAKEVEKPSRFNNGGSFMKALEKKGFVHLGQGCYSSVLGHPKSDKVIKVLHHPHRDGWLNYVRVLKDAPSGEVFGPKVYSYKLVQTKKTQYPFGIAVMEKLDKKGYQFDMGSDNAIVPSLMVSYLRYENQTAAQLCDLVKPGMAAFLEHLKSRFGGGTWDLHSENYMTRENGDFVLTDPLSGDDVVDYKTRIKTRTLH